MITSTLGGLVGFLAAIVGVIVVWSLGAALSLMWITSLAPRDGMLVLLLGPLLLGVLSAIGTLSFLTVRGLWRGWRDSVRRAAL